MPVFPGSLAAMDLRSPFFGGIVCDPSDIYVSKLKRITYPEAEGKEYRKIKRVSIRRAAGAQGSKKFTGDNDIICLMAHVPELPPDDDPLADAPRDPSISGAPNSMKVHHDAAQLQSDLSKDIVGKTVTAVSVDAVNGIVLTFGLRDLEIEFHGFSGIQCIDRGRWVFDSNRPVGRPRKSPVKPQDEPPTTTLPPGPPPGGNQ